jgi:hypothetical protein
MKSLNVPKTGDDLQRTSSSDSDTGDQSHAPQVLVQVLVIQALRIPGGLFKIDTGL